MKQAIFLISILLFLSAQVACPPIADRIELIPTPEGETTVVNGGPRTIHFTLLIARTVCSNEQCTFTNFFEGEFLRPGESKIYPFVEGEKPPCLDRFCCASGEIGTTEAILNLLPSGIAVTESLAWDLCNDDAGSEQNTQVPPSSRR